MGQKAVELADNLAEEGHGLLLFEALAQHGNPATGVPLDEVALCALVGCRVTLPLQDLGLAKREVVQEFELRPEVIRQLAGALGEKECEA